MDEDLLSSSSYDFSPDDVPERSFDLSPPPVASRDDALPLLLLLHDGQGQQDVQQLVACPMVSPSLRLRLLPIGWGALGAWCVMHSLDEPKGEKMNNLAAF